MGQGLKYLRAGRLEPPYWQNQGQASPHNTCRISHRNSIPSEPSAADCTYRTCEFLRKLQARGTLQTNAGPNGCLATLHVADLTDAMRKDPHGASIMAMRARDCG